MAIKKFQIMPGRSDDLPIPRRRSADGMERVRRRGLSSLVEIVGSSRGEVEIMQGCEFLQKIRQLYVGTRISGSDFGIRNRSFAGGIPY